MIEMIVLLSNCLLIFANCWSTVYSVIWSNSVEQINNFTVRSLNFVSLIVTQTFYKGWMIPLPGDIEYKLGFVILI